MKRTSFLGVSSRTSSRSFIEPFNLSFFGISGWGIDLDYCDMEWLALEMNRDHSITLRLQPSTAFQTLCWLWVKMKVKVAQCPILYNPMDCIVHGIVQDTAVGSLSLLQGIFPTQRLNPGLSHCRWILYQLVQPKNSHPHPHPHPKDRVQCPMG